MQRRTWLGGALGGVASLLTTDWPEAAVSTTTLFFDKLADQLVPELQVPEDLSGITLRQLMPPGDPRVPVSAQRVTLLVGFRFDAPEPPEQPTDPVPGWRLEFDQPDAQGVLRRHQLALLPTPPKDDNLRHAVRDPRMPHLPGLIFAGTLAVDMHPAYSRKLLRPGMVIEVSFGQQARAQLKLS
jgi:hypothetical protein